MGAINNKAFSLVLPEDLLNRTTKQSKVKKISKACYVRNAISNQLEQDELKQLKTGETTK